MVNLCLSSKKEEKKKKTGQKITPTERGKFMCGMGFWVA
jgi:hypothetical protein